MTADVIPSLVSPGAWMWLWLWPDVVWLFIISSVVMGTQWQWTLHSPDVPDKDINSRVTTNPNPVHGKISIFHGYFHMYMSDTGISCMLESCMYILYYHFSQYYPIQSRAPFWTIPLVGPPLWADHFLPSQRWSRWRGSTLYSIIVNKWDRYRHQNMKWPHLIVRTFLTRSGIGSSEGPQSLYMAQFTLNRLALHSIFTRGEFQQPTRSEAELLSSQ